MNTQEAQKIQAYKLAVEISRAKTSCLSSFPEVQKIVAQAATIKNAVAREQVLEVIRCGLENADDTATERGYAHECQLDLVGFTDMYPTRAAYWQGMFYTSAQAMSCEPRYLFGTARLNGVARNWLLKRGLLG